MKETVYEFMIVCVNLMFTFTQMVPVRLSAVSKKRSHVVYPESLLFTKTAEIRKHSCL